MTTTTNESHQVLPKLRRREPLRIPNACQPCRSRKIKCDGGLPACDRCRTRSKSCVYNREVPPVVQRARRKQAARPKTSNRSYVSILPSLALGPRACSPETPPTSSVDTPAIATAFCQSASEIYSESENSTQHQDDRDDDSAYCTAHGPFSDHIAATIDSKAGTVSPVPTNPVPFVDAPLFGDLVLNISNDAPESFTDVPPRAYADRLVGIYWKHIHAGEPVLDKEVFFRDYESFYSRPEATISTNRDLRLGILYIVFALAVQRLESIPSKARDEEANRYFQHAWALACPERFLWDSGSLEIVHCLMLMNRYLHCTSHRHKTWMTAGLAMRITQSMCCQTSETPTTNDSSIDIRLRQQILMSCAALDRCVSWSLGKTSIPSSISLPTSMSLLHTNLSDNQANGVVMKKLEFHEISNHIQLAQTQTRGSLSTRLGLSRLYQRDYQTTAMQLEASLDKWEHELPSDWKLSNIPSIIDKTARSERYFLHLRLLHARIFLWRPMLARFCSAQSRTGKGPATPNPDRPDQRLKECAAHCVKTAQNITALIIETLDPYEPMGILPWWYRVYYLHIAGTIFVAAMLKPDLYTNEVQRSWDDFMSALQQHGHLSLHVSQCVQHFATLAMRILETRQPDSNISPATTVQDGDPALTSVFHDIGINFDEFLFDIEVVIDNQCYND